MPRPAAEVQRPQPSLWPLILAAVLAIVVAGAITLVFPWFGLVLLVGAGLFGFTAFHYVCWGWWLAKAIRDEAEAERQFTETVVPAPARPGAPLA